MTCRICENELDTDSPKLTLQVREALPEEMKIPFCMCSNCENLSASAEIDESFHLKRYESGKYALPFAIENAMSEKNSNATSSELSELNNILSFRLRYQKKINETISKAIIKTAEKKPHNYLEIACAEGLLLKKLKEKVNWPTQGVEIDSVYYKYAVSNGLDYIINKPYSKNLFPENSKTIISIHEAIDHFNNIKELFDAIKFHLSSKGLLTVVNTIYRWNAEEKKNKFHHTTYFSHNGIIKMFELNGFNILKIIDLPIPIPIKQRIWARITGTYERYYSRLWTKHLFIAQKKDVSEQSHSKYHEYSWRWNGKQYKSVDTPL